MLIGLMKIVTVVYVQKLIIFFWTFF